MGKRNTEDLEARAREQFAEELRGYGHGFAFSDVPAFIIVPRRKVKGKRPPEQCLSVDAWRDSSRWAQVREELEAGMRDRVMVPEIPKGWSFGGIVKDAKPHRFDLRNPRIYSLDGTLIPWDNVPGEVSGYSAAHFEDRLLNVFIEAKPNDQAAEVEAFMDHHRDNGGNAEALRLFIEAMLERWNTAPPKMVQGGIHPKQLPRHTLLVKSLAHWVEHSTEGKALNGTFKAESIKPPPMRHTLAERLDAKHGARAAFDEMLLADGLTDSEGNFVRKGRKGRSEVLATWDAVVSFFPLEGFGTDNKALRKALMDYLPSFTIGERPSKLRNESKLTAYGKALSSCKRHLEDRAKRIIGERSAASE